jgi:hypothetical protein
VPCTLQLGESEAMRTLGRRTPRGYFDVFTRPYNYLLTSRPKLATSISSSMKRMSAASMNDSNGWGVDGRI